MKKICTKGSISIIFALLSFAGLSQSLYPSRVKIETEMNDSVWHALCTSVLQVNETTNEIAFKMPINSIDTEDPELDSALAKVENTYLYLRGDFPVKNLSFTDANNEDNRDYTGKAFLTVNNITKQVDYTCEVYNFDNNGNYNVGTAVYQVRIGLSFDFDPKDFKLNQYYKPLINVVKIEVSNGYINKLNMGGDTIFTK